jgi:5'-nucleotidase
MKILIANVGNIRRNEIKSLALALNKRHKVTICSMAIESSFKGQAFSYCGSPIRMNPVLYKNVIKNMAKLDDPKAFDGIYAYEFYGTPADAVSIMLGDIISHERPDLVIAGIGNGVHMGQDIFCSSNIGMAMEATYFNVPAISIAIPYKAGGHTEAECETAVDFIEKNLITLAALNLPKHTFLNINVPDLPYEKLKGIKVTRLGWISPIINEFEERTDHKGKKYYWAKNVAREGEGDEGTDTHAFDNGFVSITPINYDPTDYTELDKYNIIQKQGGLPKIKVKREDQE